MRKTLCKIEPFFEARVWGGDRLAKRYNYRTDVRPVGEVYSVVALPGHADCVVTGTGRMLSNIYREYPEWFNCNTEQLPIRVNILDPLADLSVQLHPDDAYALQHNNSRGKPEAWVILEAPTDTYIELGHRAATRQEFRQKALSGDFGTLLKFLPARKDHFIDIPAGTLHAIGKDVLTYNISRNADLTFRLFDYNRIDPKTGRPRPLHVQQVIDNVLVPDKSVGLVWFDSTEQEGCDITHYCDEPGLFTLLRIKSHRHSSYQQDRFGFITVVEGSGKINEVAAAKGQTILVPDSFGHLEFAGELDMFLASYKNPGR